MHGEKKHENGVQQRSGGEDEAQEGLLGLDPERESGELIRKILDAVAGLKFGELTLTVQDGIVVQVVRTEKRRLVQKRSASR